jgi:hypothetical protein
MSQRLLLHPDQILWKVSDFGGGVVLEVVEVRLWTEKVDCRNSSTLARQARLLGIIASSKFALRKSQSIRRRMKELKIAPYFLVR